MSYKCKGCDCSVPSGQPQLRTVLLRTVGVGVNSRTEVAREFPVCRSCHKIKTAEEIAIRLKPRQPKRQPIIQIVPLEADAPLVFGS